MKLNDGKLLSSLRHQAGGDFQGVRVAGARQQQAVGSAEGWVMQRLLRSLGDPPLRLTLWNGESMTPGAGRAVGGLRIADRATLPALNSMAMGGRVQTTELRNTVFAILQAIAPEIEPAALDAAAPLREQIDLDSMDYLNFIVGMREQLQVDIPERDYQRLVSLDDIVNNLREKLPA